MSTTTATTRTTTTTTTTVAGSPIMSATVSTASDLYGLGYPRHHLGATALPLGNIDEIMVKLEFEVNLRKRN